jgi:hypothetical protein
MGTQLLRLPIIIVMIVFMVALILILSVILIFRLSVSGLKEMQAYMRKAFRSFKRKREVLS